MPKSGSSSSPTTSSTWQISNFSWHQGRNRDDGALGFCWWQWCLDKGDNGAEKEVQVLLAEDEGAGQAALQMNHNGLRKWNSTSRCFYHSCEGLLGGQWVHHNRTRRDVQSFEIGLATAEEWRIGYGGPIPQLCGDPSSEVAIPEQVEVMKERMHLPRVKLLHAKVWLWEQAGEFDIDPRYCMMLEYVPIFTPNITQM